MRPHLFILEGPDAAGKSTLATNIADYTDGMVFRCTWNRELAGAIVAYFNSVLDNARECLARGRTMIIDRHWPSEWVYGSITRRGVVQPAQFVELANRVRELDGTYVFCSDDVKYQVERHASMKNPDHPYEDDLYIRICAGYYHWWGKLMVGRAPVARYQLLHHGGNLQKFCHDLVNDATDRILFPSAPKPFDEDFMELHAKVI